MPERARNLSEVFISKNLRDSVWRLFISAGAFGAVEFVSAQTRGSFREMFALGVIFGIPTIINFFAYASFDLGEGQNVGSKKSLLRRFEDNIFESPRR